MVSAPPMSSFIWLPLHSPSSFCARPPLMAARSLSENLASPTIFIGVKSPIGNGMSDPIMIRSNDVGKIAECAGVLDDGVVVHGGERSIGVTELGLVQRIVGAQAADDIGKRCTADHGKQLHLRIA